MSKRPEGDQPFHPDEAFADAELVDPEITEAGSDETHQSSTEQEVQELRERILRTQAELENYRRRVQREMQDERRYATQSLLVDLLPALDNMERAIDAAQKTSDNAGLLEGFRMVHDSLLSTLEKHHCKRVPAENVAFDPTLHDAMVQMPSDTVPRGHVVQVHQHGYQLHDRVIRPAQVIVSSGAPEDA